MPRESSSRDARAPERPGAAHAPHETFLGVTRFGALDGLRCLAVLPVVFHHATPRPLEGVLGKGPLGVDLFFAISGFLITTLLLRERQRTGGVDVRGFYLRRTARIFPLYYAVLALTAVRAGWFLPQDSPVRAHFFASLPAYATFTTTWFVDFGVPHPVLFAYSWSLAVEEQFYALWPWIVRGRRAAPWIACLALLTCALVGARLDLGALAPTAQRVLSGLRPPLLMGALLACVLHHRESFRVAHLLLGRRASAPLAFALLACAVASSRVPLLATHALVVLLVGACVVREDHGLAWALSLAPLRRVGEVSYGVYMLHLAAIAVAKALLGPARTTWGSGVLVFTLALPIAVAAATVSHAQFERRFLRRARVAP